MFFRQIVFVFERPDQNTGCAVQTKIQMNRLNPWWMLPENDTSISEDSIYKKRGKNHVNQTPPASKNGRKHF